MARNTNDEGALLKRTRELLAASRLTYQDIAEETDLLPNWLCGVANGRIAHPSVNRVERLYSFLAGRPLAL